MALAGGLLLFLWTEGANVSGGAAAKRPAPLQRGSMWAVGFAGRGEGS
jgi:hypothetical protein